MGVYTEEYLSPFSIGPALNIKDLLLEDEFFTFTVSPFLQWKVRELVSHENGEIIGVSVLFN